MSYLDLPISTIVDRFIAKNAFDKYINANQRKKFVELIDKITWLNKLSKETINLSGKEIPEIQIFELKLKEQVYPKDLLEIIDKAIPYQIIFILSYDDYILFSTSKKHDHPINKDNSVIDWTFSTKWIMPLENNYQLNLKISIDFIYADFCSQISNYKKEQKDIFNIINYDKTVKGLKKQITDLENAITTEKQFNKKVEFNLQLKKVKHQLNDFVNS